MSSGGSDRCGRRRGGSRQEAGVNGRRESTGGGSRWEVGVDGRQELTGGESDHCDDVVVLVGEAVVVRGVCIGRGDFYDKWEVVALNGHVWRPESTRGQSVVAVTWRRLSNLDSLVEVKRWSRGTDLKPCRKRNCGIGLKPCTVGKLQHQIEAAH